MSPDLHNGCVSIALLVDRSLIVPDHIPDLFELRGQLVNETCRQLGLELGTLIAYSEVARTTSLEDILGAGPDFVYGSNLQHALLMARAASRTTGSCRILIVTYSLPSAHHINGEAFFMEPAMDESLEAARYEARGCHLDGISIDILLIVQDADGERRLALETVFRPMGNVVSVRPGDQIDSVVRGMLQTKHR